MKKFLGSIFALLLLVGANCDFLAISLDYGDSYNVSVWQCLAKHGQGAILSMWNISAPDPTYPINLQGVQAAGITALEGFVGIGPNWNGSSIDDTIAGLQTMINQTNLTITSIYLILAPLQGAWYSDPQLNFAYMLNFTLAGIAKGLPIKIYSDQSAWNSIFADNWDSRLTNIPVWYFSYDGQASFADWVTMGFGQFTTPYLKFYQQTNDCTHKFITLSWRPAQENKSLRVQL